MEWLWWKAKEGTRARSRLFQRLEGSNFLRERDEIGK